MISQSFCAKIKKGLMLGENIKSFFILLLVGRLLLNGLPELLIRLLKLLGIGGFNGIPAILKHHIV